VDVDLGVPSNFNPNDMRLSLQQKNEDLSESVYDFIFQLMGNTFVKDTKVLQFANLEQALNHPFLSKGRNSVYRQKCRPIRFHQIIDIKFFIYNT
jgi:hypothetical protein